MIKVTDEKIVLKRSFLTICYSMGIGILLLLVFINANLSFFPILKSLFDEEISHIVFTLLFFLIWDSLWLYVNICCLISGFEKLTVSDSGIDYKLLFIKKHLDWSEVKDYGLTRGYKGNGFLTIKSFAIYFSDKDLKKLIKVKFLKRKTIKYKIFGRNQHQKALDDIIPFCEKHTDVKPFITKYDLISIDD